MSTVAPLDVLNRWGQSSLSEMSLRNFLLEEFGTNLDWLRSTGLTDQMRGVFDRVIERLRLRDVTIHEARESA